MKEIQKMIEIMLDQVKSINFLTCPHFKLESVQNLYSMAQNVAESQQDDCLEKLSPLIAGGDVT